MRKAPLSDAGVFGEAQQRALHLVLHDGAGIGGVLQHVGQLAVAKMADLHIRPFSLGLGGVVVGDQEPGLGIGKLGRFKNLFAAKAGYVRGSLHRFPLLCVTGTLKNHGTLHSQRLAPAYRYSRVVRLLCSLGTLPQIGSLRSFGTLVAVGSLISGGILSRVGSLCSLGTLKTIGSLFHLDTLNPPGYAARSFHTALSRNSARSRPSVLSLQSGSLSRNRYSRCSRPAPF